MHWEQQIQEYLQALDSRLMAEHSTSILLAFRQTRSNSLGWFFLP
jgi:hypothetical protein